MDRFLSESVPTDALDLVEEIAGYALYPGNPFRKAVMLLGPGGTGKSKLLGLIQALLGDDNVSAVPLQTLSEDRFAKASVFGKLANICGDLDARAINHTDTFKQLTGGDPLYAQHKFRDAFSFVCYALPLFSANEAPRVSDQTEAWFDRWIPIPMVTVWEGTARCDPMLGAKMAAEVDGFFVRAVAGLRRLMARERFILPPSVERARETYRDALDTVRGFVADECHLDPDEWTDKAALFRAYKQWCHDGSRYEIHAGNFNKRLPGLFPGRVRMTRRRGRDGWRGLALGVDELDQGDEGDEGDGDPTLPIAGAREREAERVEVKESGKSVPLVPPDPPGRPCGACRGMDWWFQASSGCYLCGVCHPDPSRLRAGR